MDAVSRVDHQERRLSRRNYPVLGRLSSASGRPEKPNGSARRGGKTTIEQNDGYARIRLMRLMNFLPGCVYIILSSRHNSIIINAREM